MARWLTFWGGAALIDAADLVVPLCKRYPRSALLLAYLILLGREVPRRQLAQAFWPHLGMSRGLSNLRQWVQALRQELAAVHLSEALSAGRDSLAWRPVSNVLTDWDDKALARWLHERHLLNRDFRQRCAIGWLPIWRECSNAGAIDAGVQGVLLAGARRLYRPFADLDLPSDEALQDGLSDSEARLKQPTDPVAQARVVRHRSYAVVVALGHAEVSRQPWAQSWETLLQAAVGQPVLCASLSAEGAVCAFAANAHTQRDVLRGLVALHYSGRLQHASIGLTGGWLVFDQERVAQWGWMRRWAQALAARAMPGRWILDEEWENWARSGRWERCGFHWSAALRRDVALYSASPPSAMPLLASHLAGQRLDLPLIGRKDTLADARLWLQREKPGVGASLAVWYGPHGVGKTRMLWEVVQPYEDAVWWLIGRDDCRSVPRYAWCRLLDVLLQGPGTLIDRLEQRACAMDVVWSPAQRQAMQRLLTENALTQHELDDLSQALQIWMRALGRPFLFAIDDAQWIDAASWSLLQRLVVGGQWPVLVLCTWAGEEPAQWPWQGWIAEPQYWSLGPLADDDARLLARVSALRAGVDADSDDHALARGYPLFLTHAGYREAACGASQQYRLEGLGPALDILQAAAVGGAALSMADLSHWWPRVAIERALAESQRRSLIVAQNADHYSFFHHLTRQWVLQTLSGDDYTAWSRRWAQLREDEAKWFDAARLWEQAGNGPAAWRCRRYAAQQAQGEGDWEAVLQALGVTDDGGFGLPQGQELHDDDVVLGAYALGAVRGYGDAGVEKCLQRLASSAPDAAPALDFAITALRYLGSGRSDELRGLEYAGRLLTLANRAGDPVQRLTAEFAWCNTSFWMGDLAVLPRMRAAVEDALDLSPAARRRYLPSDPSVFLACELAWGLSLSEPEACSEHWLSRAEALALQSGVGQDLCLCAAFDAFINLDLQPERARDGAQRCVATAQAHGFELWQAIGVLLLMAARAECAQPVDWLLMPALIEGVRQRYEAGLNTGLWLCARAYAAAGRWHDASQCALDALTTRDRREHQLMIPDLWRLLALAQGDMGQDEQARASARQAIELARQRGMRGWLQRHRTELEGLAACVLGAPIEARTWMR